MNRDKATRLVSTIIDSYVEASGERLRDSESFATVLHDVKTDLVGLINEIFDQVEGGTAGDHRQELELLDEDVLAIMEPLGDADRDAA